MPSLTPGTWDPYMPDTTEPQDWFFTFGSGHTWHGEPVGAFFVRINGTALAARRQMVAVFGDRWSHQYSSEDAAGVQRFGLTELKVPAPIASPGRVHYVVPLSADGETQGPLCGHDFRDEPGPPLFATDDHEVTCAACLGAGIRLGLIEPTPVTSDAGTPVPDAPGPGSAGDLLAKARRFAREWRDQDGCGAQVLDDLADAILAFDGQPMARPTPDVAVGLIELMKLAFAWRAQGSITRWSTAPSVALAKAVSAFAEQYPVFVERHTAGIADAVIAQLRAGSGDDRDPLTVARGLLQRWWLSEPPPMGSGALREHTRSFLELTHPGTKDGDERG